LFRKSYKVRKQRSWPWTPASGGHGGQPPTLE